MPHLRLGLALASDYAEVWLCHISEGLYRISFAFWSLGCLPNGSALCERAEVKTAHLMVLSLPCILYTKQPVLLMQSEHDESDMKLFTDELSLGSLGALGALGSLGSLGTLETCGRTGNAGVILGHLGHLRHLGHLGHSDTWRTFVVGGNICVTQVSQMTQ